MPDFSRLSRRERQIMDILFARQSASVQEICAALPEPPTPMAVRRMLAILQEKGYIRRQKRGREFLYFPRQSKSRAGLKALRQVLQTFFGGSLHAALATHLEQPSGDLSDEEFERLAQLIKNLSQAKESR